MYKRQVIDRNIKLVQSGLRSKLSAIMEIGKCSEETAKKEMVKIAEDNQITGQEIDWTDMEEKEEKKVGFRMEAADDDTGESGNS